MKIIIWNSRKNILDAAIKFFTHGKGTHAAFLRADGQTIHEAFYPKVRDRLMTSKDLVGMEVFELKGVKKNEHKEFEHLFDFNLKRNIKYSFADLFRYAFNAPCRDEHHTICSKYVMNCLRAILPDSRLPLVRLPLKDWASPRDLRISPLLIKSEIE